ncbi:MAG TPA: exo-beta-N-acetylmuramidase NamZ domain-containing protein [Bryobacteraceae bacterium]|nr:exo-beta-N-acetylmuramidase NamZ domain-containing protein [Bryobacteraceae bacterium]
MKLFCCVLALTAHALAQFSPSKLDEAVEQAIREHRIPGAVILVTHNGEITYRKAYGMRSLVPRAEPMTVDTIFDCASLTKVIATTSSIMKLFEDGKLRLDDRVTEYLPEFQGGKSDITVRNLLTHFSGLRPDLDLVPEWSGYDLGIRKALSDKPAAAPGARFVYSDINFILLGEIVRRLSGETLPDFARRIVWDPLGMRETMFQPPATLRSRIAPTEPASKGQPPLRGVVHDPTARFMGGIAGHAGIFSTAGDLARFAGMMLAKGSAAGTRIFSPLAIEKFTSPQSPPDQPILRGLGWDIDSPFSSNRGELFPIGSYGHTGFTGTSVWIDPFSQTAVILLTNSVHPARKPPISSLRSRVATVVAAALGSDETGIRITGYNETLSGAGIHREVARNGQVHTGLDVLAEQNFQLLKGKKIGLITNHTGLDREGRRNVDGMLAAGIHVVALFSPEHGILGAEDRENVGDSKDPASGLKVWSLYKEKNRRPSPEMLRGIDALVFDIQDIGARFYTYVSTLANAMEAAAPLKIPIFVLDRPNPITGTRVEGPILDTANQSFVGYFPMPIRHGMTIGELARMIDGEKRIGADVRVIPMKNWSRGDWFDSTGLRWVDPSPNIRSLTAALLYPGIAMLEYSKNFSVGRGTEAPFEVIGAEFIHGRELAAYLNARFIPGVRAYPIRFRPVSGNLAKISVEGVRWVVTSRESFDSVRLGLEVAAAMQSLYPGKISFDVNRKLIGSEATLQALKAGEDPRAIVQKLEDPLRDFLRIREKYLLYR